MTKIWLVIVLSVHGSEVVLERTPQTDMVACFVNSGKAMEKAQALSDVMKHYAERLQLEHYQVSAECREEE